MFYGWVGTVQSQQRTSKKCDNCVIVLTQDPSSEERFHVELHFSPGVKVSEEESAPMGFGFRPASAEVYKLSFVLCSHHVLD